MGTEAGGKGKKDIRRYLNQVGIMGVLQFENNIELDNFLKEMKDNIDV